MRNRETDEKDVMREEEQCKGGRIKRMGGEGREGAIRKGGRNRYAPLNDMDI